jgi:hypothetical protein
MADFIKSAVHVEGHECQKGFAWNNKTSATGVHHNPIQAQAEFHATIPNKPGTSPYQGLISWLVSNSCEHFPDKTCCQCGEVGAYWHPIPCRE